MRRVSVGNSVITKNLSAAWYLEFIGADFAKSFVRQVGGQPIQMGMIDTSLGHLQETNSCGNSVRSPIEDLREHSQSTHGAIVSSALVGDWGAAESSKDIHSVLHNDFRKTGDHELELRAAMASGMRVLNVSLGVPDPKNKNQKRHLENYLDGFAKIDKAGAIVVVAAGNDAKEKSNLYASAERFPGIVVGSINSRGEMSSFSQFGDRVSVLAPGELVVVKGQNNQLTLGQGTSIAAPLVSGSIVNALKVLPEMTRNNIELLMEKTGLSNHQMDNKVKIINAYKMVKVAERIRNKLKIEKSLSRLEKERLISKMIVDPETLDFSTFGNEILQRANEIKLNDDCGTVFRKLNMYREAFLLTESKAAAEEIVKMYDFLGLDQNKIFYQVIMK